MSKGRPTKYDSQMPVIAYQLLSQGGSKREVAVKLGISLETLYKWEKDPNKVEFSETIKKGVTAAKAWWLKQGRIHLDNPKFNMRLWCYFMKARYGWR